MDTANKNTKTENTTFVRELAARLIFPAFMTSCLLAVYALLQMGVHEGLAVFYVLFPGALGIWLLERALPFRKSWNQNDGDVGTDFIHMVVAQIIMPRLLKPLYLATLISGLTYLIGERASSLWPHDWPLIAQLFLMLLVAEFGRYWVHRWAHEVHWMWKFHAVHHSPNRLYLLNAGRFHPLEKIYFLIPEVVPFLALGVNTETTALYFVFNGIHGLFQHSNIYLKLGMMNYIFSMTELHRWHHSKAIEQSNTNYGNNLIVWDIIFGTFFWPKEREVGSIGLHNPEYPKDYLGQLAAPFNGDIDKPADYGDRPEYYEELALSERPLAEKN